MIVNLGSGPVYFKNRKDIINIDMYAFDEVDIVAADACKLPIEDNSVDFILNIAMLEHSPNPGVVVLEMYRILKPGGKVLAYLPFMVPYHAAPNDFYRWTKSGVIELFTIFSTRETFLGSGPTSGMLWVLEEWIATLFSFGSRRVHDLLFIILMILLFPIKYADLILNRFNCSDNIVSGFGVIAHKDDY